MKRINMRHCAGCGHFEDDGCAKGVTWSGGSVPKGAHCFSPLIFQHPDGEGKLSFDRAIGCLVAKNENLGTSIYLPTGPLGLIDIGQKLVALGLEKMNAFE